MVLWKMWTFFSADKQHGQYRKGLRNIMAKMMAIVTMHLEEKKMRTLVKNSNS